MPRADAEPEPISITSPDPATAFAHELANLLDGGHRQLGLALAMLREAAGVSAQSNPNEARVAVLEKLEASDHAMKQMTLLLHRWMRGAATIHVSPERHHTLGELIEHAVNIARPRADQLGVRIVVDVSAEAETLPAGPVYAAVDNALRNSLDALAGLVGSGDRTAISRGRSSPRARAASAGGGTITLCAAVSSGIVSLTIADDGPGFPPGVLDRRGAPRLGVTTRPDGHGLGLTLIAEISHALRGDIEIRNGDVVQPAAPRRARRARPGASVVLRYPVASLRDGNTAVGT